MKGEQITVNNTAGGTLLVDSSSIGTTTYPMSALVTNPSGGANTWLGGLGVGTDGYLLPAGATASVDLVNEKLYGFCSTSQVIHVLRRGA